MTTKMMTLKWMLFPCLLLLSNALSANGERMPSNDPKYGYDEEVVTERILAMENEVVAPKDHSVVKAYIKGYVIRNREKAERILGRSVIYFPLFEQYLKENNLPIEIKYLSIVESALNPKARSRVGAMGLWQFMPGTGKEYGLKINRYIDERCDPSKSTQAAIDYLQKQYDRYNDWALALAAYNGGPGRVARAIRRARTKDFWRLRRYLPRETRNYVPAYIAACYLMQYYDKHNLNPQYPSLDLQLTETIKVYEYYSFYRIAQLTDLPLDMISMLNPAYSRGFIPSDPTGNYLTLPKRVMQAFKDYRKSIRPDQQQFHPLISNPVTISAHPQSSINAKYRRSFHFVKAGETLSIIARKERCSIHQLKLWNNLQSEKVEPGQKLVIYHPKEIRRFKPRAEWENFAPIPYLPLEPLAFIPSYAKREEIKITKIRYNYYIVEKSERPSHIAKKINGITEEEIIEINGLRGNRKIKPGTILKLNQIR